MFIYHSGILIKQIKQVNEYLKILYVMLYQRFIVYWLQLGLEVQKQT
jgi:hypothetical protein